MAIATQSVIDGFNLQLAIFKSQLIPIHEQYSQSLVNKNMYDMLYNNAMSQPTPWFSAEVERIKAKYPGRNDIEWKYQFLIQCAVDIWKNNAYKNTDPSLKKYDEGLGTQAYQLARFEYFSQIANSPGAKCQINPPFWNDPIWKDMQTSYENVLPYIIDMKNIVSFKIASEASLIDATQKEATKKAEINSWLDSYRLYSNLYVPSYEEIVKEALSPPVIQDPLPPTPVEIVLEPDKPISIALPEVKEILKISSDNGESSTRVLPEPVYTSINTQAPIVEEAPKSIAPFLVLATGAALLFAGKRK